MPIPERDLLWWTKMPTLGPLCAGLCLWTVTHSFQQIQFVYCTFDYWWVFTFCLNKCYGVGILRMSRSPGLQQNLVSQALAVSFLYFTEHLDPYIVSSSNYTVIWGLNSQWKLNVCFQWLISRQLHMWSTVVTNICFASRSHKAFFVTAGKWLQIFGIWIVKGFWTCVFTVPGI